MIKEMMCRITFIQRFLPCGYPTRGADYGTERDGSRLLFYVSRLYLEKAVSKSGSLLFSRASKKFPFSCCIFAYNVDIIENHLWYGYIISLMTRKTLKGVICWN